MLALSSSSSAPLNPLVSETATSSRIADESHRHWTMVTRESERERQSHLKCLPWRGKKERKEIAACFHGFNGGYLQLSEHTWLSVIIIVFSSSSFLLRFYSRIREIYAKLCTPRFSKNEVRRRRDRQCYKFNDLGYSYKFESKFFFSVSIHAVYRWDNPNTTRWIFLGESVTEIASNIFVAAKRSV